MSFQARSDVNMSSLCGGSQNEIRLISFRIVMLFHKSTLMSFANPNVSFFKVSIAFYKSINFTI